MEPNRKFTAFEVMLPLPDKGIELAGYLPTRQWDGTGGDLRAAFVQIELHSGKKILLGSMDVLFLDTAFKNDLQTRLGDKFQLILAASHTHAAPNLARTVESLGRVDSAWYDQVLNTLADAINTGTDTRTVSQISAGAIASDLNVNRRLDALMLDYGALRRGSFKLRRQVALAPNPKGKVDNHVRSICFSDASGSVRACLWSFGAHPTFEGRFNAISPDFPGIVRRRIKEEGADT